MKRIGVLLVSALCACTSPEAQAPEAPRPLEEVCKSEYACAPLEEVERCIGEFCVRAPSNFTLIDPGVFTMGAAPEEPGWTEDERYRLIGISRPFLIQTTEVTRAQWSEVMSHDPGTHRVDRSAPVEGVSWYDALAYCNARSERESLDPCYDLSACTGTPGLDYRCDEEVSFEISCGGYRLPTDAEWEYAARAGSPFAFYNGPWSVDDAGSAPRLEVIGWYAQNAAQGPKPAATRSPNAFGVFDMQGNALEWTWDNVGRDDNELLLRDPTGALVFDGLKTARGGSWALPAQSARLGHRASRVAAGRRSDQGFRPVRTFNNVLPMEFADFGDRDADGLAWPIEVNGWTIVVDDAGYGSDIATSSVRRVTSDPEVADTDGDGLTDLEEQRLRLDPRSRDTDGDGLTDLEETRRWGTNPRSIDSDGDARGPRGALLPQSALFDAAELKLTPEGNAGPGATSPIHEDTDGDGFDDFSEVGLPFVADVPVLRLEKLPSSSIDMFLNATTTSGRATSLQFGQSISSEDTETQTAGFSASFYAEVFVEVGLSGTLTAGGSGVKVSGELETTAGVRLGYETHASFGVETRRSLQRERSRIEDAAFSQGLEFDSGTIRYPMLLVNESDFAFSVRDMIVNVYYTTRQDAKLRPLGALTPMLASPESFVMGPRGTAVAVLENNDIDPDRVRQFYADAVGIVLRPSYYNVEDARSTGGRPYLEETMVERCAALEIDLGPDDVRQYRIAAHVGRDPDGAPAGVRLGDVLPLLGLPLEYTEGEDPVSGEATRVLSVAGKSVEYAPAGALPPFVDPPYIYSVPPRGSRVLAGWFARIKRRGQEGEFFDDNPVDLRLFPGDRVTFFYGSDFDQDGMTNREEALVGSDPDAFDTDGDGLSDYFEVHEGWEVRTWRQGFPEATSVEAYRVYSDPRVADFDGDGWNDREELAKGGQGTSFFAGSVASRGVGTDPFLQDTDGDKISDATDGDDSRGPLLARDQVVALPLRFSPGWARVQDDVWYPEFESGNRIPIPYRKNNKVNYTFFLRLYWDVRRSGSTSYLLTPEVRRITDFAILPGNAGSTMKILRGGDAAEFQALDKAYSQDPKNVSRHEIEFEFTAAGEFDIGLYFEQESLDIMGLDGWINPTQPPCLVPIKVKVVDDATDRPDLPRRITPVEASLDDAMRASLRRQAPRNLLRVESWNVGEAWCMRHPQF